MVLIIINLAYYMVVASLSLTVRMRNFDLFISHHVNLRRKSLFPLEDILFQVHIICVVTYFMDSMFAQLDNLVYSMIVSTGTLLLCAFYFSIYSSLL